MRAATRRVVRQLLTVCQGAALLGGLVGEGTARASGAPEAELHRVRDAFTTGAYDRAAKLADKLDERAPKVADHALYLAAESEFYAGRPQRARALFDKLARRRGNPLAALAPFRSADCLWADGQRAAAVAAYKRLLVATPRPAKGKGHASANPAPARPFIDTVVARFHVAELAPPAEALRLFRAIYVEAPAHPLADEARRRVEGLAPTEPASPSPSASTPKPAYQAQDRLQRARTLADLRRYEDAAAELQAMGDALPDPLRAERDFELGHALYRTRHDYPRAAEVFLGVADKLSGERAAFAAFHGARALSRANRDDEAIAGYARVVARHPGSRWAAEAQFLMGWLELNRARFKQAVPGLRDTLARYGRTQFAEPAAWFLGLSLYLADEPSAALDAFAHHQRLAANGRNAGEAKRRDDYFRARALQKLSRTDEANALFRGVLDRAPFSYYGVLARARLRAAGAPSDLALSARTVTLGPVRPTAARDPALVRADALATAGLDVEAGVELGREEDALARRLGSDQAAAVLLDRLPALSNFRRPYQIAEARGAAALGSAPAGTARVYWQAAYPRAYRSWVEGFAGDSGAPPHLVYSIMRKESGFGPHEVSYADARGLLQMIPTTSAQVARRLALPFFPDQLFDPETNIRLAVAYIGALHRKFHQQIPLTAAAYNAGSPSVARWCDQHGSRPLDEFVELIAYEQSREYAKLVTGIFARYTYLYDGKALDLPLAVDCQ